MFPNLPLPVVDVLRRLSGAGHSAAIVGGAVRDRLLGVASDDGDWDVATSAVPEAVVALLAGATWDNRFGTVTLVGRPSVEITSFRTEAGYRDARRPDEVRFGASLEEDLARRDLTVNAIAWVPDDLESGDGHLVDPFGGQSDLDARLLRAVGDPEARFAEDALRLIRTARLAGQLGFAIEERTAAAIRRLAPTATTVSGERVRDELQRMLDETEPSIALRQLERLGLLAVILPELAALRGIPQNKALPGDALDHSLRAVDAAPPGDRALRWAALLHDIGKAVTLADGHFIDHDRVGAELAAAVLDRLRLPRAVASTVVRAIRHHMYAYEPEWSDAAVRRFIRRVGDADLPLLFDLRRADDLASAAVGPGSKLQVELMRRVAAELERAPDLLRHRRLAIDGDDVQRVLETGPGPTIGAVMDRLVEAVMEDPTLNTREALIDLARRVGAGAVPEGTGPEGTG